MLIGLVPKKLSSSRSAILPALLLLVLGIYVVPQFLRMPLTNDAQMYDLQVRVMWHGGVLYRDVLEPNLPGVVWVQSIVRYWGGWTSETLRIFDFTVFASVLVLINFWFARADWKLAARLWLIIALSWFYLSQSEWCHCQRDAWLLLPVMGALTLRRTVTARQQTKPKIAATYLFGLTFCEGFCWGCGVWLKPHIMIPALLVWIASRCVLCTRKLVLIDLGGLFVGGLLVGGLGVAWMVQYDCWLPFWDTVHNWNPRYLAAGREHWTHPRFLGLTWRLSPWILLHVPAVVIAITSIKKLFFHQGEDWSQALLSACYLGWMTQVFLLQHLFDYIHAPVVLMAILVVATPIYRSFSERWCRVAVTGFAALALLASPLTSAKRADAWWACLQTPSNAELYNRLAVLNNPQWNDLARVEGFLREQNPEKQSVCCYHSDFVSLYNRLELLPPTRYVYVQETLVFFPDRRREILDEIQHAPHRFIVTDMVSARLSREEMEKLLSQDYQSSLRHPTSKQRPYPWGFPVVFRSGNYLVHQVPVN